MNDVPNRYAPPWTEEQGLNHEGRPKLDPLQMVDALATCIMTRQWRKAFDYLGDLQTAIWAEALREAIEKGDRAEQELARLKQRKLEESSHGK